MKPKYRLLMWIVMIFGGLAVSIYFDLHYFRSLFLSWKFHLITLIPGIALLNIVRRISRNTGRTLARYGRKGDIPKFQTNVLVDKGPYAYMRHPMHLGLLFFPLSFGLIAGSPVFILIVAPLEIAAMLLMIKYVEEPEARKKFGEAYDRYITGKPWFCLRWKCIKALLKDVPPADISSPFVNGCH